MTEDKLESVAISMEGKAPTWFQYVEETARFRSWAYFKEVFLVRFRSVYESLICEKFLNIRQETTMEAYQVLFESLVSPLHGRLSSEVLEGTYMKGLRPAIRAEVRTMKPKGLSR